MRLTVRIAAPGVLVALYACGAVDQVLPPLQKREAATAPAADAQLCEKFDFASPLDVDTAYIRAVREFGFTPVEEIERQAKGRRDLMLAPGLKHNKTPGVMYNMAQGVRLTFVDRPVRPWFNMDLLKATGNTTRVVGDFCYQQGSGVGDVRPAILGFTKNVFKK